MDRTTKINVLNESVNVLSRDSARRFAFIMLPYSLKDISIEREVMVDYETGHIYMKKSDGNIISITKQLEDAIGGTTNISSDFIEINLPENYPDITTLTDALEMLAETKLDITDFNTHANDTNIHVSASEKLLWNSRYSNESIDNKLSVIKQFEMVKVASLPTENISSNTIYLVEQEDGTHVEYVYISTEVSDPSRTGEPNRQWEILGKIENNVDLSGYYTSAQVDTALNNKMDKVEGQLTVTQAEKNTWDSKLPDPGPGGTHNFGSKIDLHLTPVDGEAIPEYDYRIWIDDNSILKFSGSTLAQANVTAYSDLKLKENLEVIPDALEKICCISGYTYLRKDLGIRQTGVVAQEIQEILPEAVIPHKNVDGEVTLTVAYGNLVGLLIEGIKELKNENVLLNLKIEELASKVGDR